MNKPNQIKLNKRQVTLDDQELTIAFDLNSFAELEEEYGNIDEIMDKLASSSPKNIRKILWAGLQHEHPEITEREVGRLLGFSDIPTITKIIMDTMVGSLPKEVLDALPEEERRTILSLQQQTN